MELWVKVVPNSSHSGVIGELGDALKVKITQVAEKGKANKELCEVLAKHFGVATKQIEIISGHTQARKRIRIAGYQVNP